MHATTVPLKLAAIEVPVPQLNKAQGFVEWGGQHGFMKEVLALIEHSPTAAAMCARRALFTAGQGFVTDKKLYPKLHAFLKKIALRGRYRTANKLLRRLSKDFAKLRAFALQIVWSKDGKYITEVYHQRIEQVASGPLNDNEEVDTFYLCRDWTKLQLYKPQPIAAFNPETAKKDKRQLLFYFGEDAGSEYYPTLELAPVLNYMKVEGRLSKYHDNRVATRFGIDTLISIRKGPIDETLPNGDKITAKSQRDKFTNTVKDKYQGEEAESVMILWGDGTTDSADKMAEVQTITTVTPETYESVAEQAKQAILSVGGVTSPVVVGLPGGGTLGGDGAEIREAFEMYFNTVCRPDQVAILECFYDDILPYVKGINQDLPGLDEDKPALDILTTLPIKFMFSEATLENILDEDELRSMINYGKRGAGAAPAGDESDERDQDLEDEEAAAA
ncbi:hypothetical protein [Hymenobacter fodinae]|uniref:Phage portal protein n=1 Tax=Hymenobacter fodinae TaxID=2510796 RepID=A0A4Z0P7I0_9BACT|nr:hypothetical protein [Hymenobacter fodinae]TGE08251.1 hypothetical protein EU556_11045 [Hymenobacter fodinae]